MFINSKSFVKIEEWVGKIKQLSTSRTLDLSDAKTSVDWNSGIWSLLLFSFKESIQTFHPNQIISKTCNDFYLIIEGVVRTEQEIIDNNSVSQIYFLCEGDFVNLLPFFNQSIFSRHVAHSKVSALQLDPSKLENMLLSNPGMMVPLCEIICKTLIKQAKHTAIKMDALQNLKLSKVKRKRK